MVMEQNIFFMMIQVFYFFQHMIGMLILGQETPAGEELEMEMDLI